MAAREHFIPMRKAELVDRLARDPRLAMADALAFRKLAKLVEAVLHFEHHAIAERLKRAYAPFDPDSRRFDGEPPADAVDPLLDALLPPILAAIAEAAPAPTEMADADKPEAEKPDATTTGGDAAVTASGAQKPDGAKEAGGGADDEEEAKELEPPVKTAHLKVAAFAIQLTFDLFDQLLANANFVHLSAEVLRQAMEGASVWGVNLEVDLDAFERLEVYSQGELNVVRSVRRWRRLWRREMVDIPAYRRLALIFKLKDRPGRRTRIVPELVYVKYFKEIPKLDLEMLLPYSRFRMTKYEQGQIILPTLTGVGMALMKVVGAFAMGIYGLVLLVVGMVGYGFKSYQGYLNTRQRYQLNLTESLYYQSLDNNAGVFFRVLDEAEEQECRETLLAYFLLWQQGAADAPPPSPNALHPTQADRAAADGPGNVASDDVGRSRTMKGLDRLAEAWLFEALGAHIDFEVDDAVAKLLRLKLATVDDAGRYAAVPIQQALEALEEAWRSSFGPTADRVGA